MPRRTPVRKEMLKRLSEHYDGAKPGLDYTDAYQLLVATILSAQCTDVRVNKITPALFARYPNAESLANADPDLVAELIRSCGFYVVKTKNLIATANILVSEYGGEVPAQMKELTKLPGVGRKTANVVRSNAFGIPGMAVDTHVFRVSHRLGLSDAKNPEGTEQQLCHLIEKEQWTQAHHWLIWHGRKVCHARSPKCDVCVLLDICPSAKQLLVAKK